MNSEKTVNDGAPLGLDEEFPQYVWLSCERGRHAAYACGTQADETFVMCFRSLGEAVAADESRPILKKRPSWFWKPKRVALDHEEHPLGSAIRCVEEANERTEAGRYIRGLALVDAKANFLMKRYVR